VILARPIGEPLHIIKKDFVVKQVPYGTAYVPDVDEITARHLKSGLRCSQPGGLNDTSVLESDSCTAQIAEAELSHRAVREYSAGVDYAVLTVVVCRCDSEVVLLELSEGILIARRYQDVVGLDVYELKTSAPPGDLQYTSSDRRTSMNNPRLRVHEVQSPEDLA
jgi:hypothetical protein